MHNITLHDLISRGSNWLVSFLQQIHPNMNVFANFSTEETEKPRTYSFWGKKRKYARNTTKGIVEILKTDEIMAVFHQGNFFNNR